MTTCECSLSGISDFRHPWCSEVHFARDIEALGHTVTQLQEPVGGNGADRFVRGMERKALRERPDVVFFTRTWGLPKATTQTWRRLEAAGVKTASYHLDLYVGLKREAGLDGDPFWTTQHVFTPDGDPRSAAVFARRGINHHWSPPAVVSDECEPGAWRDTYDYDVVFVGSRGYHAEWPWRVRLLDWLAKRYGRRFRRFGGDCPEGPTRGADLNDLYATARVVVGDSLCLPGHTLYWSDRFYETVGRGGFLIGPRVPGVEEHFTDGEHLRLYDYGDLDALGRMIDAALDDQEGRRLIAKAGQEHVRERHTYKIRFATAFDVMGL